MIKRILKFLNFRSKPSPSSDQESKVVSIGDIAKLKIPKDLEYAGAIEKIKKEAAGTGVTLVLENFYTVNSREFHNFVSSITYRFLERDGIAAIAYLVEDHDLYSLTYYEVDYGGNVLFSWSDSSLGSEKKSKETIMGLKRANETLGVFSGLAAQY